jgi:hypothetical protein
MADSGNAREDANLQSLEGLVQRLGMIADAYLEDEIYAPVPPEISKAWPARRNHFPRIRRRSGCFAKPTSVVS